MSFASLFQRFAHILPVTFAPLLLNDSDENAFLWGFFPPHTAVCCLSDELEPVNVSLQPPANQQREQRAHITREPQPLEIALLI